MDDYISRQAALNTVQNMYDRCDTGSMQDYHDLLMEAFEILPSVQPTLYGYNVKHLDLIARVLQQEGLPPERVTEALTDIGRIVAIVKEEFEESLRKAVEQCKI